MLKDAKAAAFTRHFTSAWLRLDKLGKMPPSGGDFQFYKNLKVEPMLLKQVTTYFEEILNTNGRISQFIDSDYTYMNQVSRQVDLSSGGHPGQSPPKGQTRRSPPRRHLHPARNHDRDCQRSRHLACHSRHLGSRKYPRNSSLTSPTGYRTSPHRHPRRRHDSRTFGSASQKRVLLFLPCKDRPHGFRL